MIKKKKSLVGVSPYKNDRTGIDFCARKILRLDWNEALVREPKSVTKAIVRYLKTHGLNFYPDTEARELRAALSGYTKTKSESIVVYNGSDTALKTIFDAFVNPNDRIFVFSPTYAQIVPFIKTNGGRCEQYIPRDIFSVNKQEIISFLKKRSPPRAVYINNPNNPTGTLVEPTFIKMLCRRFPETLFIIDEAYIEFAPGKSCVGFVSKLKNVIVVRSLSKAFRLAGIRLGYTVASGEINGEIMKIHNGKDINVIAHIAGVAAIRDTRALRKHIRQIQKAKLSLKEKLRTAGFEMYGDYGNFLVVRDRAFSEIKKLFFKNGILIRDRSALPRMKDCVRITISYERSVEALILRLLKKARESHSLH